MQAAQSVGQAREQVVEVDHDIGLACQAADGEDAFAETPDAHHVVGNAARQRRPAFRAGRQEVGALHIVDRCSDFLRKECGTAGG